MTATEAPVASAPNVQDGKSPVKDKKSPKEVQEEASTCLTTGKRHLLVNDVPAAVAEFAQACELLSAEFGETAKECAESYYYYGKSLLEMSRLESGVLGNALDGVPEEEDEANNSKVEDPAKMTEEEKKEVEEKVGEALNQNFDELEKKAEEKLAEEAAKQGKSDEKEAEEDEGMEEGDDSQEDDEESQEEMDTEKDAEKKDGDEEKSVENKEEEEEPSNLQLAWEMLELAKVVYTKQMESADEKNKKDIEEKLCRSILTLGEVSIENENYSQAVEDIEMCLKKQESFPKDSRLVAETHYQLGVAQGFNSQFDVAVESLNSAIMIIKDRVKNLKALEKASDEERKEIEELEALIPEIEEKIADTKDMKKEAESKPKEDKTNFEGSAKGDAKSVSSIAVKRKAEENDAKNKKPNSAEKTAAAV